MVKEADPFYLKTNKRWQRVRLAVFRRDQWQCQSCDKKVHGASRGGASPHCDHIEELKDNPSRAYDMSNLQTLCASCHSKRTAARRVDRDKPKVRLDGWLVDE